MFGSYNSIDINKSELEGRYIIATKDIEVGEDLLKCRAYFSMTSDSYKKLACANCVKQINRLPASQQKGKLKPIEYKCQQCNEIWYCSETCKNENQPQHQHYECKFFKRFRAPKLTQYRIDSETFTEIRMIVGLLSRYYQDKLLLDKFSWDKYKEQEFEKIKLNTLINDQQKLEECQKLQESFKSIEDARNQDTENLKYMEIQDSLDDIFGLVENNINDDTNKCAKDLIDIIIQFISNLFELVLINKDDFNSSNSNIEELSLTNIETNNNNNNNNNSNNNNNNNNNLIILNQLKLKIRELIHKVRCNQFGIWTKSDKCLAVAISPSSSYFNHSCIPNCINIRDGNKMTFKSLYPVKKGQQLSISYLELDQPTQCRKDYLKYGYYFNCGCPRCDETQNKDDQMDNWISKFYCKKSKCTGLYYSKSKISNLDQSKKSDKFTLICSDCSNELIINSTFFNNSPFE